MSKTSVTRRSYKVSFAQWIDPPRFLKILPIPEALQMFRPTKRVPCASFVAKVASVLWADLVPGGVVAAVELGARKKGGSFFCFAVFVNRAGEVIRSLPVGGRRRADAIAMAEAAVAFLREDKAPPVSRTDEAWLRRQLKGLGEAKP